MLRFVAAASALCLGGAVIHKDTLGYEHDLHAPEWTGEDRTTWLGNLNINDSRVAGAGSKEFIDDIDIEQDLPNLTDDDEKMGDVGADAQMGAGEEQPDFGGDEDVISGVGSLGD